MTSASNPVSATCCIVGGGPAGAVLGLLLARAGIDVVVLEKHADFLRDFRGDTIHASTVQVLEELGLRERFLRLPHQVVPALRASVGGQTFTLVDFSVLGENRSVLLMPQWDFLDFITTEAARYPGFRLMMETEVTGLRWDGDRVVGVVARRQDDQVEIRSPLIVACDGRDSTVRRAAGLPVRDFGAPMDVLWFRLPRDPGDPQDAFGRVDRGRMLVLINRGEYWQTAYVIAKGTLPEIQAAGIEAFRASVARLAPFLDQRRLEAVRGWDDVKLLRVQVNRARRWHRPGLLLIGDAAHAMSPIGGVGINLAVQDAVAAANILARPLACGTLREADLARVRRRRLPATVVTQALQRLIQARVLRRVVDDRTQVQVPAALQAALRTRPVQRVVAHLIAVGVRPEHVRPVDACSLCAGHRQHIADIQHTTDR